jgi:chromosome segregation ATPase
MNLRMRRLGWVSVIGLVVVGAVALRAQSGKPSVDGSMTELVGEVRALRQAVERSTSAIERATEATTRSQTLLGRVQLQENRLADLGRRLDEARQRVRTATAQAAAHDLEVARVLGTVDGMPATDPERAHMDRELKTARTRAAAAHGEVAQLRSEEQELIGALSTEQARWSDYNQRLEAIERDLATPRP